MEKGIRETKHGKLRRRRKRRVTCILLYWACPRLVLFYYESRLSFHFGLFDEFTSFLFFPMDQKQLWEARLLLPIYKFARLDKKPPEKKNDAWRSDQRIIRLLGFS